MATQMVRQAMFTTGEVDAINYKRTDFSDYLTAAQSLLNCEVGTTGLAKKRKGTERLLDLTSYAEENSKLYEFTDKSGDVYIAMSANEKFYIFNTQNDLLATSRDSIVVTSRSTEVAVGGSHNYFTTVVTPYFSSDLNNIDYTLDNDSLILTHPDYPPARIYISSYAPLTFSYQVLNIYPLPAWDFNIINYNAFTVAASVSGNIFTFSFTGLASDPGFTTDWVGGQIIGPGNTEFDPLGYAIITGVTPWSSGTHSVTFTANIAIPFSSTLPNMGSQYSVRQAAWGETLGYPSKVLYYQNRLWLANTKTLNSTIFGSRINAPSNFDAGVGRDTDAIIYTIGQSNTGGIQWMNGGKQLEIYTKNYEFACPQDQNSGLTPGTFSIRQQSAYGCSKNIKPITYINDSYYITKTGTAIINYRFNGIGQTYTSTNISVASSHLVKSPKNCALLRGGDTSQDNFIYFLNNDNTVTAFQFATEYKLAALTPIDFNTDAHNPVEIKDIATIDNKIYFLKKYTLSGKYSLEVFNDEERIDGYATFLMASNGVVSGLSDYEGYEVQVVFSGQDFGQYVVTNGTITVHNPLQESGFCLIGLLYRLEIKPMYLFAGSAQADYMKNISEIYVDYYNSLDFSINGTLVNYQVFSDIQAGIPLTEQSGTAIVSPTLGWNRFNTFSITQNAPFDCQITAISYQITASII